MQQQFMQSYRLATKSQAQPHHNNIFRTFGDGHPGQLPPPMCHTPTQPPRHPLVSAPSNPLSRICSDQSIALSQYSSARASQKAKPHRIFVHKIEFYLPQLHQYYYQQSEGHPGCRTMHELHRNGHEHEQETKLGMGEETRGLEWLGLGIEPIDRNEEGRKQQKNGREKERIEQEGKQGNMGGGNDKEAGEKQNKFKILLLGFLSLTLLILIAKLLL